MDNLIKSNEERKKAKINMDMRISLKKRAKKIKKGQKEDNYISWLMKKHRV